MTSIVLGRDDVGVIARNADGMAYYLTPCCAASAKGCADYIGCRACYAEVDPGLGGTPDAAMVLVDGAWTFVPRPLALVETYGDGVPLDDYVAARPAVAASRARAQAERDRLAATFRNP